MSGALAQGPAVAQGDTHHKVLLQTRKEKKQCVSINMEVVELVEVPAKVVETSPEMKKNMPPVSRSNLHRLVYNLFIPVRPQTSYCSP